MSRSPTKWQFTVEDRGIQSAVVDKYPDLFASDPVLCEAWAAYQAAEFRINERMAELASKESHT